MRGSFWHGCRGNRGKWLLGFPTKKRVGLPLSIGSPIGLVSQFQQVFQLNPEHWACLAIFPWRVSLFEGCFVNRNAIDIISAMGLGFGCRQLDKVVVGFGVEVKRVGDQALFVYVDFANDRNPLNVGVLDKPNDALAYFFVFNATNGFDALPSRFGELPFLDFVVVFRLEVLQQHVLFSFLPCAYILLLYKYNVNHFDKLFLNFLYARFFAYNLAPNVNDKIQEDFT